MKPLRLSEGGVPLSNSPSDTCPPQYSRSEVVLTFFERSPLDQVLRDESVHRIQPSIQSPAKISGEAPGLVGDLGAHLPAAVHGAGAALGSRYPTQNLHPLQGKNGTSQGTGSSVGKFRGHVGSSGFSDPGWGSAEGVAGEERKPLSPPVATLAGTGWDPTSAQCGVLRVSSRGCQASHLPLFLSRNHEVQRVLPGKYGDDSH